jgi:transcriptional regulator with XRE-family HTH domain
MLPDRKDPRQADGIDIDIGRLVRVHRMAHGLSQTELGNQIGVTFQQVQKYESGANRISMGRLTRIAHVLGVRVIYLLGGSKDALPNRAANAKEEARLAEATRMLGLIGAVRLLRAFSALPTTPTGLRESIVRMVEGSAAIVQTQTKQRSTRRGRLRRKPRSRRS